MSSEDPRTVQRQTVSKCVGKKEKSRPHYYPIFVERSKNRMQASPGCEDRAAPVPFGYGDCDRETRSRFAATLESE